MDELLRDLCSDALQEECLQKLILLTTRINERMATVISAFQRVENHLQKIAVHCPPSGRKHHRLSGAANGKAMSNFHRPADYSQPQVESVPALRIVRGIAAR